MLWESPLQKILDEQGFIAICSIEKHLPGDVINKLCCGQYDDYTHKFLDTPIVIIGISNEEEYNKQHISYNQPIHSTHKPGGNYFFRCIAE